MKWLLGRGPVHVKKGEDKSGLRVGVNLGPLQADVSVSELKDAAVNVKNKAIEKATELKNRVLRKKAPAELSGTVDGVIENEA